MNVDSIRQDCWNQAVRSFGTAYIFESRANSLKIKLQILTFLGIVVPVTVGSLILSFDTTADYLPIIKNIAGLLITIQLIVSVWSLVAKWDDMRSYAIESNTSNKSLTTKFRKLAKNPPGDLLKLQLQYELIQNEYDIRSQRDEQQGVTEKEKRKGMRAALIEFQRRCANCNKIPTSMKPSRCSTCGKF